MRLSKNQFKSTVRSQFLYVKKKYINIASINITLTEINKEAHYVAKNIKKHPKKQAKNKPPPSKINQVKTAPIRFALSV